MWNTEESTSPLFLPAALDDVVDIARKGPAKGLHKLESWTEPAQMVYLGWTQPGQMIHLGPLLECHHKFSTILTLGFFPRLQVTCRTLINVSRVCSWKPILDLVGELFFSFLSLGFCFFEDFSVGTKSLGFFVFWIFNCRQVHLTRNLHDDKDMTLDWNLIILVQVELWNLIMCARVFELNL